MCEVGVDDHPPWSEDHWYELQHDTIENNWEVEQIHPDDVVTKEEGVEVEELHTEVYDEEWVEEDVEEYDHWFITIHLKYIDIWL